MPNTINIKELDLKSLKAVAYDLLANIEEGQRMLNNVNEEIGSRLKSPVTKQAVENVPVMDKIDKQDENK